MVFMREKDIAYIEGSLCVNEHGPLNCDKLLVSGHHLLGNSSDLSWEAVYRQLHYIMYLGSAYCARAQISQLNMLES